MVPTITPYILCGGKGKRLEPLSRLERPKSFLTFGAEDSLLEQTAQRVADDIFHKPYFVANVRSAHLIESHRVLIEPLSKNTAMSIALAATHQKEGVLLVLPSDHVIEDRAAFISAVKIALPLLENYDLVLFGLKPTAPSTLYGYIETGAQINGDSFAVKQFVEKPNLEKAQEYFASEGFLWNRGMFLFEAQKMIELFAKHQPDILENVRKENFAACEDISFDYAIAEKVEKAAVVGASFDWRDLGSWADASTYVRQKAPCQNYQWGAYYIFDDIATLFDLHGKQKVLLPPKDREQSLIKVAGEAELPERLLPHKAYQIENPTAETLSFIVVENL